MIILFCILLLEFIFGIFFCICSWNIFLIFNVYLFIKFCDSFSFSNNFFFNLFIFNLNFPFSFLGVNNLSFEKDEKWLIVFELVLIWINEWSFYLIFFLYLVWLKEDWIFFIFFKLFINCCFCKLFFDKSLLVLLTSLCEVEIILFIIWVWFSFKNFFLKNDLFWNLIFSFIFSFHFLFLKNHI